jgi:hypothetical protein
MGGWCFEASSVKRQTSREIADLAMFTGYPPAEAWFEEEMDA